mgnify:CR=1 FL=1
MLAEVILWTLLCNIIAQLVLLFMEPTLIIVKQLPFKVRRIFVGPYVFLTLASIENEMVENRMAGPFVEETFKLYDTQMQLTPLFFNIYLLGRSVLKGLKLSRH